MQSCPAYNATVLHTCISRSFVHTQKTAIFCTFFAPNRSGQFCFELGTIRLILSVYHGACGNGNFCSFVKYLAIFIVV